MTQDSRQAALLTSLRVGRRVGKRDERRVRVIFGPAEISSPQKAGRTDAGAAEAGNHGVGGRLGLAPPAVRLTERELPRCGRRRGEAFDPDSDEADVVGRAERGEQRPCRLEYL